MEGRVESKPILIQMEALRPRVANGFPKVLLVNGEATTKTKISGFLSEFEISSLLIFSSSRDI